MRVFVVGRYENGGTRSSVDELGGAEGYPSGSAGGAEIRVMMGEGLSGVRSVRDRSGLGGGGTDGG
jgi:hypothetical protein